MNRSTCTARAVAVGACLLGFLGTAFGEQFDIITQLPSGSANITKWRINKPNIQRRVSDYPNITFQPGDFVTVDAGGCAQTGGHGKTWKRYVDPQGPNADRLYHGLISIPGLTHGLVRLKDYGLKTERQIPTGATGSLHLQLGYEDDGYGDNGYWGREGDDGTGGQCKGLPNAYVVIAIRRGGNPGDTGTLVGIPHNVFRHQGAWHFSNFNTADMSWNSFTDAFDLGWSDYANPVTYVMFGTGRSLASGGNCEGMCLLANAGEKEFVLEDNLTELFWPKFTQRTPVEYDINVCQWRQFSTYFIQHWLHSMFDAPTTIADQIDRDTRAGNYGILTLAHGWEGHAIVPLSVERSGANILIHVYDPNQPCVNLPDNEANFPPMVISGNNWSFPMGGQNWTQADGRIAYIPYAIDNGWRDLANGLGDVLQIVVGQGASVDQISDSTGRKLFTKPRGRGLMDVDGTNRGLGRDVVKMVYHGAIAPRNASATKKPQFTLHKTNQETPELANLAKQMNDEYGPQYGGSREVYFVLNHNLKELNVQVTPNAAGAHRQVPGGPPPAVRRGQDAGRRRPIGHPTQLRCPLHRRPVGRRGAARPAEGRAQGHVHRRDGNGPGDQGHDDPQVGAGQRWHNAGRGADLRGSHVGAAHGRATGNDAGGKQDDRLQRHRQAPGPQENPDAAVAAEPASVDFWI